MRVRGCIVGWLAFLCVVSPSIMAAESPGVSKDAIKIGIFGPLTGSNSVFAKAVYGTIAIYKDINERGGINGRKLELVVEDDACDPKQGTAAVKKLMDQDKVFLLHGAWCSSVALAAKPDIVANAKLPYVVLGAGSAAISEPAVPNIFHPLTTSLTVSKSIVAFALSKPGAKKIAIVTQAEAGPQAQYKGALGELKAKGLAPVADVTMANGIEDATEQVTAIKNAAPDAVLAILYPAELGVFLRDAYKAGLRTTVVTVQGTSIDDTRKRVGIRDVFRDLYFFYPLNALVTDPSLSKYAQLFKKYYPNENLDTIAFMGMTGALAIIQVLERLGPDVTQDKFLAEMNRLKNFDPGILPGPVNFSPQDHIGVKDGKMITLIGNRATVISKYPVAAGN